MGIRLDKIFDSYFDPPEYSSDEVCELLEEKIDDLEIKIDDLEYDLERAKERNEPMLVSLLLSNKKVIGYLCPECDSTFVRGTHDGFEVRYKYCPNCGQALKWEEEKNE